MKWVNPVMGLLLLLMWIWILSIKKANISMWDYEGFSMTTTTCLLMAITFLVHGIYLIKKNDTFEFGEEGFTVLSKNDLLVPHTEVSHVAQSKYDSVIHTSMGNFHIQNMFVKNKGEVDKILFEKFQFKKTTKSSVSHFVYLAWLVLFCLPLVFLQNTSSAHNKLKSFLPLKKIKTTQIEGTIVRRADVSLKRNDRGAGVTFSLGGYGIEEFPNIYFNYYSGSFSTLNNSILNFQNSDSQKVEELNASNKFNWEYEKFLRFPKGTKVKMKVRTKDYEDLKEFMKSDDFLTNNRENFNLRNSVKIYEFAVNDEIILQKVGLK